MFTNCPMFFEHIHLYLFILHNLKLATKKLKVCDEGFVKLKL